jgi:nitronate monooxygenase
MVEGKPAEGVLPSGQVAVAISQLPPVGEMIAAMAEQARARIAALGGTT